MFRFFIFPFKPRHIYHVFCLEWYSQLLTIWIHFKFVTGTWLIDLKRWYIAYRSNDLKNCNKKNDTEIFNLDFEHEELDGYKNYPLSELLIVLIEKFVLKVHQNYVSLNLTQ